MSIYKEPNSIELSPEVHTTQGEVIIGIQVVKYTSFFSNQQEWNEHKTRWTWSNRNKCHVWLAHTIKLHTTITTTSQDI